MKKLLVLLTLLLGVSSLAYAGYPMVGSATTPFQVTTTVFNDSGSTIASGWVVVWDNDDTEFDRNGYPYVTTTTTADDDWVAGVVADGQVCPDQSLCEIVVRGMALTLIADGTDDVTEDTTVSTTTVAGMAGDWDGGANECYLGLLAEDRDYITGTDSGQDGTLMWVFVNPGCED